MIRVIFAPSWTWSPKIEAVGGSDRSVALHLFFFFFSQINHFTLDVCLQRRFNRRASYNLVQKKENTWPWKPLRTDICARAASVFPSTAHLTEASICRFTSVTAVLITFTPCCYFKYTTSELRTASVFTVYLSLFSASRSSCQLCWTG